MKGPSYRSVRAFAVRCLALLGVAVAARAHPLLQDAMWVQFEPSLVRVAVAVSLREISVAQGVALNPDVPRNAAEWNRLLAREGDYVLNHLTLTVGSNVLAGTVVHVTQPPRVGEPEQTFFQFELHYPFRGPPPVSVNFFNAMLQGQPYAAGTPWDVSYVIRAKRPGADSATSWLLGFQQAATIPTGWENATTPAITSTPPVVVANSQSPSENGGNWNTELGSSVNPPAGSLRHRRGAGFLPAGSVGSLPPVGQFQPAQSVSQNWRTCCDYLWHGVWHILTGWDHLLFVCALILATRSLWEMVKVIAAFTLAHTLTLTLCVFGIFRLPAFIVEPLIALSIVIVALENVVWPQRARSRMRLAVAFGFGLVHGLGFAGGLLDAMAGLPAIGLWIALGAFSLGVEIGHQIVVLPLFGLLSLSRHNLADGFQSTMLRYGSSVISGCGVYYLFVALQEQVFSRW